MRYLPYYLLVVICTFQACKSGPFNLLKPPSPHQQYERKLVSSGLNHNAMGAKWISTASGLLQKSANIKLPYKKLVISQQIKLKVLALNSACSKDNCLPLNCQSNPSVIFPSIWMSGKNEKMENLKF